MHVERHACKSEREREIPQTVWLFCCHRFCGLYFSRGYYANKFELTNSARVRLVSLTEILFAIQNNNTFQTFFPNELKTLTIFWWTIRDDSVKTTGNFIEKLMPRGQCSREGFESISFVSFASSLKLKIAYMYDCIDRFSDLFLLVHPRCSYWFVPSAMTGWLVHMFNFNEIKKLHTNIPLRAHIAV